MYTPKTENGDMVLDQSKKATFLTASSAAKQLVMNAFLMWRSEWFLRPADGIDWLLISEKNKTIDEIIQIISSGLVKNPYIQKVIDISINMNGRTATINYIVLIDNANIIGSVSL